MEAKVQSVEASSGSFLVGRDGRKWQRKLKRNVSPILSAKAKMRWGCLALVLGGGHVVKQMAIGAHDKKMSCVHRGKENDMAETFGGRRERKGLFNT